jgi:hypothetical protein
MQCLLTYLTYNRDAHPDAAELGSCCIWMREQMAGCVAVAVPRRTVTAKSKLSVVVVVKGLVAAFSVADG